MYVYFLSQGRTAMPTGMSLNQKSKSNQSKSAVSHAYAYIATFKCGISVLHKCHKTASISREPLVGGPDLQASHLSHSFFCKSTAQVSVLSRGNHSQILNLEYLWVTNGYEHLEHCTSLLVTCEIMWARATLHLRGIVEYAVSFQDLPLTIFHVTLLDQDNSAIRMRILSSPCFMCALVLLLYSYNSLRLLQSNGWDGGRPCGEDIAAWHAGSEPTHQPHYLCSCLHQKVLLL